MAPGDARLRLVSDDQSTIHVGRALRDRRRAARLTQEQAAGEAGITRNALAALEKKELPNPSLRTLLSLMRVYGSDSLDALLGPMPSWAIAIAWQAQTDGE